MASTAKLAEKFGGGKGKGKGKGGSKQEKSASARERKGKSERKKEKRNAASASGGSTTLDESKMTRKQRRKAAKGKGKGKGGQKERKEHKDIPEPGTGQGKKKRASKAERRRKAKAFAGDDAEERAPALPKVGFTVKCRRRHAMAQVTENPARYVNQACCDICGEPDLPKKKKFFFHCSQCRWDKCARCAEEEFAAKRRKRAAEPPAGVAKKQRTTEGPDRTETDGFTKARLEIEIPTEETAFNRAPQDFSVVSDWKEGVPV